jgi:flagellar basal body rod protein FlgC
MISEISAGVSGLNAAITQLDVSAGNIASQSSTRYVPQQVVTSSLASGGAAANVQPVSQAAAVDLAQQVIDTSMAGYTAQANIVSIRAWDETMQRALNITA